MADERRVVEARQSFTFELRGAPYPVSAGDRFWSDDPIVKGRDGLFRDLVIRESRPAPRPTTAAVETATADPGAARKMSRPQARSKDETRSDRDA